MEQNNKYKKADDYFERAKQRASMLKHKLDFLYLTTGFELNGHSQMPEKYAECFSITEKQCIEAIERMKLLGLSEYEIGHLVSQGIPLLHCHSLYTIDDKCIEEISEFEQKYGGVVYAVIRTKVGSDIHDSLLYVCDTQSEWDMDRQDIRDQILMTFTFNQNVPEFSEFGSIGYQVTGGKVLIRTA